MGSGKTGRIVEEGLKLLEVHPATSMLFLASNHTRQKRLNERLLAGLTRPKAQLPVYTYSGYVRTTLFNFWPLVEAELTKTMGELSVLPRIRPELSGMEDTELMLRWLLAGLRARNPEAFEGFPGNERGLITQLVRRIRLRSENRLSRGEMARRSALMDEMCPVETAEIEKQFDWTSFALRTLDPSKQLDVFHRLLEKNPLLQSWMRENIRHLVVDDVDETIPACQAFIEFLAPSLDTLILAADLDGGSRRGYLNAYPYDWEALKAMRPGEVVRLERDDTSYQAGQLLLENWQAEQSVDFQPLPAPVSLDDQAITRIEMMDRVLADILGRLASGYAPGDLCVVLPKTDPLSFYQLRSSLQRRGVPVQLLSGTQRPSDNPVCRAFLYMLQLVNADRWQVRLSSWEFRTILLQGLRLNGLIERQVLDRWVQSVFEAQTAQERQTEEQELLSGMAGKLPDANWLGVELPAEARLRYDCLRDWLEKASGLPFEKQLHSAFREVLAVFSTEQDGFSGLKRMIESYSRQQALYQGMMALGKVDSEDLAAFDRWWLAQAKTGKVADTPDMPEDVNPNALIIGTPQKVIDTEAYRKIQYWLDTGSREWARSDNAPLYNAWVHSAVWDGSHTAFSEEFNEAVIRTRAGHITRTLMLLASERVCCYASELDDEGFTHSGLLKPRLLTEEVPVGPQKIQRASLREDQRPVLDYAGGTMAITAVPGAGKTFVNVELILELVQRGVEPDHILVLTYMDSAAKTLLSRLKAKLAGVTNRLPTVSTIHSLALRIMTENDHAVLLGFLPEDVTILDDYGRNEIMLQIANQTLPESAKGVGDWLRGIDRGISHAKTHGLTPESLGVALKKQPQNFRLTEFLPAYKAYQAYLRQEGYLDFTDLITHAVSLLERYPELRDKYRDQFRYIIEDEAQDSSRLLQRFISLLGGDSPSLIRTGDTNQSITTTFSSADTSVFRGFIEEADHVIRMTQSGRCAPEIIHLANTWLTQASSVPGLEKAFQPVEMQPVIGQNPELLYPLEARIFDIDKEEEAWLLKTIKQIRQAQPTGTIAILARTNGQVTYLSGMLQQAGVPAISLSEKLNISPVFNVLLAYLRVLEAPGDVERQLRLYRSMVEAQLLPFNQAQLDYLETTPLFYQSPQAIDDETFRQWYYDWLDFSREAAGGNLFSLLVRMTDRLFGGVSDRSNGYLCALQAQELLRQYDDPALSPLELLIDHFETYNRSFRGKKGFSEILGSGPHPFVQVMSMHKAKGQEFDVVFMPGLQAEQFPHEAESIRFDESDRLMQELDRVSLGGALSETYQQEAKRAKVEEEARLLYVGLSRAKKALFLSAHQQTVTRYNKLRRVRPAMMLEVLKPYLNFYGTDGVLMQEVASEAQNKKGVPTHG